MHSKMKYWELIADKLSRAGFKKQPSGFKLYAIIVAAILTCVAVICAVLISFTIYEARRLAATAEDNALEAYAQAVSSLANVVDAAARRDQQAEKGEAGRNRSQANATAKE